MGMIRGFKIISDAGRMAGSRQKKVSGSFQLILAGKAGKWEGRQASKKTVGKWRLVKVLTLYWLQTALEH